MPPLREAADLRIIRPLIERTREQVEKYLTGHGIKALTDRSNRSPKYLRNRVRHALIPLLEKEYNPKIRRHLAQLAGILRDDLDWMKREASAKLSQIARVRQGKFQLSQDRLRAAPAALRRLTLRMAVERVQGSRDGFRASHWMALDRLLTEGAPKALDLPHGLRAEATDEGWILLTQSGTLGKG